MRSAIFSASAIRYHCRNGVCPMADEMASPKLSANQRGAYDIMDEMATLGTIVIDKKMPFLKLGIDDTTVVLLATGLIEKFLWVSLIALFRRDVVSKTMITNVFEGDGPLATFSAKIEVCAGLGSITDDVRHDLKIIKKIRNDFAHSPNQLYLKDFSACRSLKLKSKIDVQDDCNERKMFKDSCVGVIGSLTAGTLINIAANRFVAANTDGVMREYEAMTKSLDIDETPPE
jgi:DNA-binding MltR family transcriptional regulator